MAARRAGDPLLLAGTIALAAACNAAPMASRAECEHLRDRYVDLELSASPAARTMTSEARARFRGQIAADVERGPWARALGDRCDATVREAAFTCAVTAPTLDAWERCMK